MGAGGGLVGASTAAGGPGAAWWRRGLAWLPSVALAALAVNFFLADLSGTCAAAGLHRPSRLVDALRDLPPDATVAGVAWYSAPALSLLAQRPLADFTDLVIRSWIRSSRSTSSVTHTRRRSWRASSTPMPTRRWPTLAAPVRSTDWIRPVPIRKPSPSPRMRRGHRMLVMEGEAGEAASGTAMAGFYRRERDGRWMSSHAWVRLRYDAGSVLVVQAYLPALHNYRPADDVRLQVWADGCELGDHQFAAGGLHALQFPVPALCALADGQAVLLRLAGSALMKGSITRDGRALFVKMQRLGFAPPAAADPATDAAGDGGDGQSPAAAPGPAATGEEASRRG